MEAVGTLCATLGWEDVIVSFFKKRPYLGDNSGHNDISWWKQGDIVKCMPHFHAKVTFLHWIYISAKWIGSTSLIMREQLSLRTQQVVTLTFLPTKSIHQVTGNEICRYLSNGSRNIWGVEVWNDGEKIKEH